MVEHLNRLILQLLHTNVTKESGWEKYHVPHTVHSSIQVSLFKLMFGRHPQFNSFPGCDVYDPTSYQKELQTKLAKLQDMMEPNIVQLVSYHCDYQKINLLHDPV